MYVIISPIEKLKTFTNNMVVLKNNHLVIYQYHSVHKITVRHKVICQLKLFLILT